MKKLILLLLLLCSFNAKSDNVKPLLMSVGLTSAAYVFRDMLDNSRHPIGYRRTWNIGLYSLLAANELYFFKKYDKPLNIILFGWDFYLLYACCGRFVNF